MNVDVLEYHSCAVDTFDDGACARVLQNGARHVQFFVERADDEVAVQNVIAASVNHSYNKHLYHCSRARITAGFKSLAYQQTTFTSYFCRLLYIILHWKVSDVSRSGLVTKLIQYIATNCTKGLTLFALLWRKRISGYTTLGIKQAAINHWSSQRGGRRHTRV